MIATINVVSFTSLFAICLTVTFVKSESEIVTVTVDPPPSSSPATSGEPDGDNEAAGSSTSTGGEEGTATIESLNFRVRYVEEVLTEFARNIRDLTRRVKYLESMTSTDKPGSKGELLKMEARRLNRNSQYHPYSYNSRFLY